MKKYNIASSRKKLRRRIKDFFFPVFFFKFFFFLLLDRLQFFIVKHKFNNVLLPNKSYVCNFVVVVLLVLFAAAFAEDFLENVNDIKDIINGLLKDYDFQLRKFCTKFVMNLTVKYEKFKSNAIRVSEMKEYKNNKTRQRFFRGK